MSAFHCRLIAWLVRASCSAARLWASPAIRAVSATPPTASEPVTPSAISRVAIDSRTGTSEVGDDASIGPSPP
jgi:hypothetical protein